MGSHSTDQDEVTVLVTGFGPFRENFPVNPSWEIAKGLPAYLPPLRAKGAGARRGEPVAIPDVRILVHPEPIRVNYNVVRELVPDFWRVDGDGYQGRRVDIVIHIGMAGLRPVYQIERRGHRTGYKKPDVDGRLLEDEGEGKHDSDWIWYGVPDELETDLDMADVLHRWVKYSPESQNLIISENAGRYLCDFTYFSSLAHLWKQQRPRKVVFFHVPSEASEEAVLSGQDLCINLIRSIVESEVTGENRRRESMKRAADWDTNVTS